MQSRTGPVPSQLPNAMPAAPLPRAGNWTRTLQIRGLGAGLRALPCFFRGPGGGGRGNGFAGGALVQIEPHLLVLSGRPGGKEKAGMFLKAGSDDAGEGHVRIKRLRAG